MSPTTVMKVVKRRSSLRCLVLCSVFVLHLNLADAKPANNVAAQSTSVASSMQPLLLRPSRPVYSPRSMTSASKKVLTSWNDDGSWQASARLPTSSQSGGNGRSRYKIRRDGSLSLALQAPKSHTHLLHDKNRLKHRGSLGHIKRNRATRNGRLEGNRNDRRNGEARQFSPTELRSFSVVISDVDVSGDYNTIKHNDAYKEDAYAKAGVSSYHLKSNSIHRMNASWKLKPGNGSPTSSDLLEFLSYFANGDGRATRSDLQQERQKQQRRPLRKILGQEREDDESGQITKNHNDHVEESKQPFLTWQESSRHIPLVTSTSTEATKAVEDYSSSSSEVESEPPHQTFDFPTTLPSTPIITTETINIDGSSDIENGNLNSSKTMNESKVVLHELISTLEELNKDIENQEAENKSSPKEKSRENQTRENAKLEDSAKDFVDLDAFPQEEQQQETELDQTNSTANSENRQEEQVQVDVEMSESSVQGNNATEKEGDVFAQNDEADFSVSTKNATSNNNMASTAYNSSFTEHDHHDVAAELEGRMMANRRRSAKSAFFDSPKSTNSNGDNNNNTASTSATSLEEEEEVDSAQNTNSRQRMKITDPQQTASDLKKLMALILKSDGNRNTEFAGSGGGGGDGKSGTQVVNIVITPNQDGPLSSTGNNDHPQLKNNPQKILFLKTPQVKQMLDIALSDPALSNAAHKIAAALETNPYPNPIPTNVDHTYSHLPSFIVKPENNYGHNVENLMHESGNSNALGQSSVNNNSPSTPDGFPLTGNGFLNLHHPNLQFHQALHHMVVNGTTPTSINATTKTNIINIFVINFKENNKQDITGVIQQAVANQSPFRINIKPSPRPQYLKPRPPLALPLNVKPLLIESTRPRPTSPLAALVDQSLLFNNKMGLAAGASNEDDEKENGGGISSEKNYTPNKHFDMDHYNLSNADKINIFDLLPGDIGTVTSVQYAPGVDADVSEDTNENHNSNNKNQTVSHFLMADKLNNANQQQHQQGSNNNGNSSNNSSMVATAYGDYFADFLPDRSREPPGSENMAPQENQNINEHNILSILTSSRKPIKTLPPYSDPYDGHANNAALPPSLAHLEWIFKNQPPPKPQIVKRKGSTGETEATSDSMMEPDETGNNPAVYHGSSTQDLVDFLMKLQNVTRSPLESNSVLENTAMPSSINTTIKPQTMESQNEQNDSNIGQPSHAEHTHNDNDNTNNANSNDKGSIIEYTTKSPAFWKFGNKLPIGAFSTAAISGNEEALNNRLRKLITAFGYSALPTLAAGAAATWPYWVPIVATGRRRRKRSPSTPSEQENTSETREIIKRRGQQFLSNLMKSEAQNNNENGTAAEIAPSSTSLIGPSNRQLLSKSTKNSRLEGTSGEKKWIKVDVIAATVNPFSQSPSAALSSTSSPTLLNFEEMNGQRHHDKNGTSFHSQSHNNRLGLNTKNNSDNNSRVEQKHHGENDSESSSLSRRDENKEKRPQNERPQVSHDKKQDRISLSAEQQLDVPLLKNFLKNVLHNEFSLSNMNTPSPIYYAPSSAFPPSVNNAQKFQRPPPSAALPFLSASVPSLSTPTTILLSTTVPPLRPVMLAQVQTFTPTLNKIITKNGHHSIRNPQQQQHAGGNNKNSVPLLLSTPFSRPSSTPLPPSLVPFLDYDNKGENDSIEEHQHHQQVIAGSDKKVVSITTFSTPSPTSVYIHNRGDGTTSVVTTKAPAPSASLVHWQNNNGNNNSPWGIATSSTTTVKPDKISSSSSTSSSVTTSLANTAAVASLHGHNDDMSNLYQHLHHLSSLSSGQTFINDANNLPSSSNSVNYFQNHFHHSNKRLQKIKLADSIKESERSYSSAALLPLWFPIFFGNHSQLSSKLKHLIETKPPNHH